MKRLSHFAAMIALLGTTPLHAAPEPGSIMHDTAIGKYNIGVGATVGIRIPLGSSRVVRKSERVKLGISAGPIFMMPDQASPNGLRRGEASFVGIELKPGYTTSFNFAGYPIATSYTTLGAAENDKNGDNESKQSTGAKIGWIALVAGGVMVALVGTYVLSCGPGEDNSCGSD